MEPGGLYLILLSICVFVNNEVLFKRTQRDSLEIFARNDLP